MTKQDRILRTMAKTNTFDELLGTSCYIPMRWQSLMKMLIDIGGARRGTEAAEAVELILR